MAESGKLDQRAAEVMAELKQIREEIAAHDYRASTVLGYLDGASEEDFR